MADLRIVVVGAGRVSRELAPAWQQAGHDILHVVSRTAQSAQPLGEALRCSWSTTLTEAAGALSDAEVVVVAVTDGLISEISAAITPKKAKNPRAGCPAATSPSVANASPP